MVNHNDTFVITIHTLKWKLLITNIKHDIEIPPYRSISLVNLFRVLCELFPSTLDSQFTLIEVLLIFLIIDIIHYRRSRTFH